jgi:hypothetical protein
LTTEAIAYVSIQGLGDEPLCLGIMNAFVAGVRGFNSALGARAANFTASVMDGPDDAENIGISSELYLPFTGGVFPMVYFSLTYDPSKLPAHQLLEWEEKYDLKVIGRTVSSLDILGLDPSPSSAGPN